MNYLIRLIIIELVGLKRFVCAGRNVTFDLIESYMNSENIKIFAM